MTSEVAPAAHATAATPPVSQGATAGDAPNTDSNTAPVEPPVKIAVLLPSKDSVFSGVTQSALNGIVASNYAVKNRLKFFWAPGRLRKHRKAGAKGG